MEWAAPGVLPDGQPLPPARAHAARESEPRDAAAQLGLCADACTRRRESSTGHASTGGRFHGKLIERDSHVLEVIRYIALNPVRAGFVRFPEDWRWSSHEVIIGPAVPAPPFLARDEVLGWFDGSPARSISGSSPPVSRAMSPTTTARYTGVDRFVRRRSAQRGPVVGESLCRCDGLQARPEILCELLAATRCVAERSLPPTANTATRSARSPLSLAVHVSTVSRALRRYEADEEAA